MEGGGGRRLIVTATGDLGIEAAGLTVISGRNGFSAPDRAILPEPCC